MKQVQTFQFTRIGRLASFIRLKFCDYLTSIINSHEDRSKLYNMKKRNISFSVF